jgi:intracellular sulfur oxidation DsrE/DsrF family protein
MFSLTETIHRRGFLGSLAATAALGVAALSSPAELLAQKGKAEGPGDKDLDAWLGKIKGKHRQVFDATAENEGMPFAWPRVFLMTAGNASAVVILRHDAIPLALDHPLWEKYKLGEFFKVHDKTTKEPATHNPYLHPKPGELMLDSFAIDELMKDGVMFGACNMAIKVYSGIIAKNMNMDADAVMKDWVAGVIPGMQVVPSGVMAVNRAQEFKCTYCYAGG